MMFNFLEKKKISRQLDEIIQRIEMNVSNNYKDAAQLNLKELERKLTELEAAGKLDKRQMAHYSAVLDSFKGRMKNFTHKDQKSTWV